MAATPKQRFVGVIGAGRSGLAAARLLHRQGARVLLSDQGRITAKLPAGIETESGGHSNRLLDCDLLVRSPGVPGHLAILRKAAARRIPIWSELELAARSCQPRRFVAVTGTNGKTTTTALVGELFKAGLSPVLVGGNIGTPLSDLVPKVSRRSTVVLEVSSYQLEDIDTFHPQIAAVLNITPDHLEHHGSMKAYAAAKARIFENQNRRDVTVFNADDAWCRKLAKRCRGRRLWFSRRRLLPSGVSYERGDIVFRWGTMNARWPLRWNLPGPHNIENALAATAMAAAAGIPTAVIRRVLERFRGVEHRLELVKIIGGVRYVNDSKATNVDSTRVALESFAQPLVIIMGGEGKGAPYKPLAPLIRRHVKTILLIGEDAPTIRRELRGMAPMEHCGTMKRAVARARRLAQSGDVVLLSPACASFDQYRNYEERGRDFKALVRKL